MDRQKAVELLKEWTGIDEQKLQEFASWAKENCICPDCPTYLTDETQLTFCLASVGQSQIITDEKNCLCGQCPVFNEANLRFAYYCTRDSEVAQTVSLKEAA